jgi:hypothetical protein
MKQQGYGCSIGGNDPAILNVKLTRERRSKMGLYEPVICTQLASELAWKDEDHCNMQLTCRKITLASMINLANPLL